MNERPSEPNVLRVPTGVRCFWWSSPCCFYPAACHTSVPPFLSASAQIDRSYKALGAIDELVTSLLDAENGARAVSADRSLLAARARTSDARPRVAAATAALGTLEADDPRQRQRAEQLRALSGERLTQLQSAVESH